MLQDIDGVLHGVVGGEEGVRGCKCACIGDEVCYWVQNVLYSG